jgi:cytochrome c
VVTPARSALRLAAFAAALALAGCGPEGSPGGTQTSTSPQDSAPDLARGELLSLACQACHTLNAGGVDGIGPNLYGVFGRPAAARQAFAYSQALRTSDLVWTPEAVEGWLKDPAGFIVGNTMAFTGYQSARDRRDLIAFLIEATGPEAGH